MAINFKKFWQGLKVVPKTTSTADSQGDLEVLDTDGKLRFHNGTSVSPVVTETHAATLENKTIDADLNLILDLEVDNLKTGVLNVDLDAGAATDAQIPSALAVQSYVGAVGGDVDDLITLTGVPAGSTDLGTFTGTVIPDNSDIKEALQALETSQDEDTGDVSDLITLSGVPENSTDLGTFTGTIIPDASDNKEAFQALETALEADIAALAAHINDTTDAHDASAISLIPTGSVTATDVQAGIAQLAASLGGNVAGPASSTDNALVRFDGTTGKLVQNSVATLSDSGILLGLAGLNSTGQATFVDTLTQGVIREAIVDDNVSGANASISALGSSIIRLTNSGLTSVSEISSQSVGAVYTIINATGNSVTINNAATAGTGIKTGTKSALTLADEASIIVKYDNIENYWMVIGGSGAGGGSSLDTIFQLVGTDVASWSTGDNATFLGGGTLSGTFVANTSTPLNGIASYQYTQAAGSLNDYLASPAQAVAPRFRGTPVTLSFPYLYNGGASDIEVIFYDVTNAAIIPSSVFLPIASTNSIFKTNITIPATCASIRIGFHVKVLSSGAVFQFDDVQLSANNVAFADISNRTQSTYILQNGAFTNATITGVPAVSKGSGVYSYNSVTGVYTVLTAGVFDLNTSMRSNSATTIQPIIVINASGAASAHSPAVTNNYASTSWSGRLDPGNTFTFDVQGGATNFQYISVSAIAANANILTAPDTFSTDFNALTYANAATYTPSTLVNAPVGTYITFTTAVNTNNHTQTTGTNRPTQTDSDMAANGIRIYGRAWNAASTSALPSRVMIQIGKGFKGLRVTPYISTGKTGDGTNNVFTQGNNEYGTVSAYNELTGILTLDAASAVSASNTFRVSMFGADGGTYNGYFVVNASKNPALTGLNISAVAARGVSTSAQSIPNGANAVLVLDNTKTFDTHGALNPATGTFTAPEAGFYSASSSIKFQGNTYTVGNQINLAFYKNGTIYTEAVQTAQTTTVVALGLVVSDVIYLAKGDTLQVQVANARTAGSSPLTTAGYQNYFAITKTSVG